MIFQNHQTLKTNAIDCMHKLLKNPYICHQTDFRQKENCFLNILFPVHMTLHTFSSTEQLQSLLVPAANNPFDPPQKEFFRKKNKITHLERSGYLTNLSLNYFITHHF